MTPALAVLRPEPGNAATAARAVALGFDVIRLPLFAVRPVDWVLPDIAAHDALLLTSANSLRHGGVALTGLRTLPVYAVGTQTATAAQEAGFDVKVAGDRDGAALLALAEAHGVRRALYLGGQDRMALATPITHAITVYASDPIAIAPEDLAGLDGSIALLHSARAARRLRALIADPARLRIAALSKAVAEAASTGWSAITVAQAPDDAALIAAACALID